MQDIFDLPLRYQEVNEVSEKERGDIMEALKNLPEKDKQFVLGYAAGVSASATTNRRRLAGADS